MVLFFVIILFWKLWVREPKVAVDHPFWYKETLDSFLSFPYVWRELLTNGLGESVLSSIWNWPVLVLYGLFSRLGYSFEVLTLLLGIVPALILAFISIQYLLSYLKIEGFAKIIGSFFYLTNTYFILLIDGGQLNIAIAYSLLPLAFVLFRKAIEDMKNYNLWRFVTIILVISFLDIRLLFLLSLLILINLFFEIIFEKGQTFRVLINYLKIGSIASLFLSAIHAYWFIPALLGSTYLPSSYGRVEQLEALSFSQLSNSLFFMHPNWFQNVFGRAFPIKAEFVIIPILVFLAPLLHRRNRWVGFWLLVALLTGFLSKGSNPPFGEAYILLLKEIPGFVAFRDPSKFYMLLALSFSVLIAFSVQAISIKNQLIILIIFIYLVRPVYLGQMTGIFSSPVYKEDYGTLTKVLKEDPEFSRILWLPVRAPLGYSSPNHPSIEAIYMSEKRPFASGTVGTYESLNFLREGTFMGEILDISGIGYIAYPPLDLRRDDPHPDTKAYYYKFLSQLSTLNWISEVVKESKVPLLKTKRHQDRFFITANNWLVIGADDLYNEATKSAALNLQNNSLVFAEEEVGLSEKLIDQPEFRIVLNKKNKIDLAASLIPLDSIVFPAEQLDFSPKQNGWWKRETVDYLWMKDFLDQKYQIKNLDFDFGRGLAIGEGNLKLKIKDRNLLGKDKVLLARVLESSRAGQLSFYQREYLIGRVTTKGNGDNIRWFEVGTLREKSPITIESFGEINIVNALTLVSKADWERYIEKATRISEKITDYKALKNNDQHQKVDYQQMNPTKYKVKISGVSAPVMLVFSQSYDPDWVIGDNGSVPVYSLLNGFMIEKDGEYIVEYKPQKCVYPGLLISAITLIILLFFLTKPKTKFSQ